MAAASHYRQFIEDTEELRETMGFSGFRKILVVSWGLGQARRLKKDKTQPTPDEVSQFLMDQNVENFVQSSPGIIMDYLSHASPLRCFIWCDAVV